MHENNNIEVEDIKENENEVEIKSHPIEDDINTRKSF